ncbi:MAG: HIT family protein [Methanomicrobiales archaeon]
MTCIFCHIPKDRIILSNDRMVAIFDRYPVNPGHMLIIPKRHFDDFFNASDEEIQSITELIRRCKDLLDETYHPDGYNIGVNCGMVAGQTVMHMHVHLIPRYAGDVEDPKGGVRGVIPEKRIY